MEEIESYIHGAFSSDVDAKIRSLENLGRILTESISNLTETKINITKYFIVPSDRSASCTFHAQGKFPITIYEGVCSFSLAENGNIRSSCDVFPFWRDLRLTSEQENGNHEMYIHVNVSVEREFGNIRYEYFWTEDSYGEWEHLKNPRRGDHGQIEIIIVTTQHENRTNS